MVKFPYCRLKTIRYHSYSNPEINTSVCSDNCTISNLKLGFIKLGFIVLKPCTKVEKKLSNRLILPFMFFGNTQKKLTAHFLSQTRYCPVES